MPAKKFHSRSISLRRRAKIIITEVTHPPAFYSCNYELPHKQQEDSIIGFGGQPIVRPAKPH